MEAFFGLVGVLLGVLLGEYFRRSNRVELYSEKLFDRRLEIYEELMHLIQDAYSVGSGLIERTDLAPEVRHEIVSVEVLKIASFVDTNELFLNQYVSAHVTGMIMGVEDIADIKDASEREDEIEQFRESYLSAKKMIREESGVEQINQHFQLVSKSRPDSPMIRLLKHLESKR